MGNQYENTSPSLAAPDTLNQSSSQEGLRQQAERSRAKKNAGRNVRNLIILVVVIAVVVMVAVRMMSSTPQQQVPSGLKKLELAQQAAAQQPVVPVAPVMPAPVEPIKIPDQTTMPVAAPAINASSPAMAPQIVVNQGGLAATQAAPQMPVSQQSQLDVSKFVKAEDHELLAARVKALEEKSKGIAEEIEGLKLLDGRIKKLEEKPVIAMQKRAAVQQPQQVKQSTQKQQTNSEDSRPGFWIDANVPAKSNQNIDGGTRERAKVATGTVVKDQVQVIEDSSAKKQGESPVNIGNRRVELIPYQLVAIVQDRAWVKLTDGSMKTVQRGDKLPNGDTVMMIDASKDEVKTSSGVLR
jgi:predicted lipid-binding transport protein (Tim44 family)